MDSAGTTGRKFPAYTTAQLRAMVYAGTATPAIIAEIVAREAGQSLPYVVPQLEVKTTA